MLHSNKEKITVIFRFSRHKKREITQNNVFLSVFLLYPLKSFHDKNAIFLSARAQKYGVSKKSARRSFQNTRLS